MRKDRDSRGAICLVVMLSLTAICHLAMADGLPQYDAPLEDYFDCSNLDTPWLIYKEWIAEWRQGIKKLTELDFGPSPGSAEKLVAQYLAYAIARNTTARQKAAALSCFQKEIEKLLKEILPEEEKATIETRRKLANLEAELIYQRHQTIRFLKVQIFLEQIENHWEDIETIYPLIISNSAEADNLHQQWLDEFGLLVEEFKPGEEQEQIYDVDEFYSQLDDIQFFFSNVPSSETVKDSEQRTIFYIKDLQKKSQIIKEKIQWMKNSSAYQLYVKYTGDTYIVSELEKMLASVDDYIVNAENTKQAIHKKLYVREKMPRDIYQHWTDVLASNAVISMTDEMLQDYSRFLASEGMIIRVSQTLSARNRKYLTTLNTYLSPYLAQRTLMANQKYLEILEKNIHESFIHEMYKSEIQMEIDHNKYMLNRFETELEEDLEIYDQFKNERKRLTEQYLSVYAEYMTDTCREFADMIMNDESDSHQVNIEHEKSFRIFKSSCVEEVRQ